MLLIIVLHISEQEAGVTSTVVRSGVGENGMCYGGKKSERVCDCGCFFIFLLPLAAANVHLCRPVSLQLGFSQTGSNLLNFRVVVGATEKGWPHWQRAQ